MRCILIAVLISLSCLACLPDKGPSSTAVPSRIPITEITLPADLNLRENLIEMRGLTADFTPDTWKQYGLHTFIPYRTGSSYYLIGQMQPVPTDVYACIILEDRPDESKAWIVTYYQNKATDFIEVFSRTETQTRTVGSNWRSGKLYIQLTKGEQRYAEHFTISSIATLVPYIDQTTPE